MEIVRFELAVAVSAEAGMLLPNVVWRNNIHLLYQQRAKRARAGGAERGNQKPEGPLSLPQWSSALNHHP